MLSSSSPQPQAPGLKPTLYLIDGSGFIFRAYHALPGFTDPAGTPVGAVLGFTNMLLKLRDEVQGGKQAASALSAASCDLQQANHGGNQQYMAVVFDAARLTFRNRIYPEYKAHRPPPPDDLVPQFALVREATDALCLPRVEMADYEADDLIATYAKLGREAGMRVVIVSSDKDLMQLICDGVEMFDPMKNKPIGEAEVLEKFGVDPCKVRDVLALVGDSSDNVPGVPGIGPKTAAELVGAYGSLEGVLNNLENIKQPKRRETLAANVDNARVSYALIGLKDDVPVAAGLEAFQLKQPDMPALQTFLQRHGFKSVLARLGSRIQDSGSGIQEAPKTSSPESPIPSPQSPTYALVQDEAALKQWIADAYAAGAVAVDTETTSLDATRAELVGVSLCVEPGKACYIPLGHVSAGTAAPSDDLFAASAAPMLLPGQLPRDVALALLKPLLEDPAVLKIGHNIKYDALVLRTYGIRVAPVEDTMLLSYVLSAGLHGQGMDELAQLHLGITPIAYDEVTGTGRARISFAEVALNKARDYAAEDADITLRLHRALKPQLVHEQLVTLYETIERPLIPVLTGMEAAGVKVDVRLLSELSNDFGLKMHALEEEIHALAGRPFNVGSPKQLGEILFDELKLPGGKKSGKTGAYGTDSGVLEELAEQGHGIAQKVLDWRQLAKLKGTYTDALKEQINPLTGRVHTSFSMAVASTGRLSSTDPNLQNIPIRTLEGKKIRRAFVAEAGSKLISADYSQIELRLLAHIADIGTLKSAFQHGDDIHAITASQMFGVSLQDVTPDLRRSAKTINFGIIYGISAHGLAMRLGIGRAEAAAYIEQYFRQYPGIRDYMEAAKQEARDKGYVTTLYGRRCHLPGIADKNPARRQFSERAAINAPLQGTAADIIKRAMITIDRATASLLERGKAPRMLLQVHDELVFEVAKEHAEDALAIIKPAMENAAALSVPLIVEAGIGDNWGEIH